MIEIAPFLSSLFLLGFFILKLEISWTLLLFLLNISLLFKKENEKKRKEKEKCKSMLFGYIYQPIRIGQHPILSYNVSRFSNKKVIEKSLSQ